MQENDKKLYVGSLPYRTTEEDLRAIFNQYGEVTSVNIVIDRASGRSKGFGFVEMANLEDAKKALEAVNGSELGGRALIVCPARPQTERRDREEGGNWSKPRREGRGRY